MLAKIYRPTKNAMQSGQGASRRWVLEFEPAMAPPPEMLMGWTSSGDMRQQVRLSFSSKEEAIAYCERHGIAYQVTETVPPVRHGMSYSDNFSFKRRDAWTH